MGELNAINKAVDLMIEDGIQKAVIFTDSKNACLLLKNNTSHNYLVNIINKKVNSSNLNHLTLVWVPSHVGISSNERADYFAKQAADVGCVIPSSLAIKDACSTIYDALWNEWVNKYRLLSISKGTYFAQFFPSPPKRYWHSDWHLEPGEIKLINRLLAGHTYSKVYLHQIKAADTNLCPVCSVPETENHSIFICKKYDHLRSEFNFFNNYNNLPDLLKNITKNIINELCNFIHSAHLEL